jgi:hypothetical protein
MLEDVAKKLSWSRVLSTGREMQAILNIIVHCRPKLWFVHSPVMDNTATHSHLHRQTPLAMGWVGCRG